MLQNAYFVAKIGAETAVNEQHFAEILPKIGNYPKGSAVASAPPASPGLHLSAVRAPSSALLICSPT